MTIYSFLRRENIIPYTIVIGTLSWAMYFAWVLLFWLEENNRHVSSLLKYLDAIIDGFLTNIIGAIFIYLITAFIVAAWTFLPLLVMIAIDRMQKAYKRRK